MKVILLICLLLPLTVPAPAQEFPFQPGHTHDLLEVKFSPDNSKLISYSFDFGSRAILLPETSALFAVPREIPRGGNVIRFDYSFQKEGADGKAADYGEEISSRFGGSDLPEM